MPSASTQVFVASALHAVLLTTLLLRGSERETIIACGALIFFGVGLTMSVSLYQAEHYWPAVRQAGTALLLATVVNALAGIVLAERFARGSQEAAMVWLAHILYIPTLWALTGLARLVMRK